MHPFSSLSLACIVLAGASAMVLAAPSNPGVRMDVARWRLIERESGPVNYYRVLKDSTPPCIRAEYRPPFKTAVMGYQLADADRKRATKMHWRWRALKLPKGGDECVAGKTDSAAVVYVTWRSGLRWYTLKYVWSSVGKKGAICASKRNPFVAQDTVILESGGPSETWRSESIDLKAEFRTHFADGRADANVPELLGVGLMSDGDQTQSESSADYADFWIER